MLSSEARPNQRPPHTCLSRKKYQIRLELMTGVRRRASRRCEAARFARRLTPVIQTVARFARLRRTKDFFDFTLWENTVCFSETSLIGRFRASRCHHRVRLEKSCPKIPTRGLEIEFDAS